MKRDKLVHIEIFDKFSYYRNNLRAMVDFVNKNNLVVLSIIEYCDDVTLVFKFKNVPNKKRRK